ncbi:MAG: winged helix-turn-helix domain-containing protein [Thermoplasmatales archaeon]
MTQTKLIVLFLLSNRKITLYELSALLGRDGKRMSSGTLLPIMRKLEEAGYVVHNAEGRHIYYSLSEEGVLHLEEIRSFMEDVKQNFVRSFIRDQLIVNQSGDLGPILDQKFLQRVENLYQAIGNDLVDFISAVFLCAAKGNETMLFAKEKIRDVTEEIRGCRSQKRQDPQ